MFREIVTWLTTSCPPSTRRLGYLQAAIGLESRARRCRKDWAGHLEQCRQAVSKSVERCRRRRTALVLGSGLALEYPLAQLSAQFERVVLADIVHLPAVRRLARRYSNVELVACDLSGLADELLEIPAHSTAADVAALVVNVPEFGRDDVDWVVSCNLLSQLPLLPVAWLARRCPQLDDNDLERWGRTIMTRHLDWLGALDAERCLIADAEQFTRDRRGMIVEHADISAAFGLDRYAYASWEWKVAPPGELPGGLSAAHRIVACHWPSSAAPAKIESLTLAHSNRDNDLK